MRNKTVLGSLGPHIETTPLTETRVQELRGALVSEALLAGYNSMR